MIRHLKFYRPPESPQIYFFVQKLLAPEANLLLRRQFRYIFDKSRKKLLDLGCGPSSPIQLPKGIIIGADLNLLYIKNYIGRNNNNLVCTKESIHENARFGCVCSADSLPFGDGVFDETRCIGAFHHLNRDSVLAAIKEMVRCTRSGGRIIIFDSVWPKNSIYRPIAWLLCYFDRGKWMLREEELLGLAKIAYNQEWYYRRFTYTFTGLEGLFLSVQRVYKNE